MTGKFAANRGLVVGLADQNLSDLHVEEAKALIDAGYIPPDRGSRTGLVLVSIDLPFRWTDISCTND